MARETRNSCGAVGLDDSALMFSQCFFVYATHLVLLFLSSECEMCNIIGVESMRAWLILYSKSSQSVLAL